MQKPKTYPIEILLIESCPKNIGLVKQMLNSTKFHYNLHIVNNVKETHHFLQKEAEHKNAPKPDAILINSDSTSDFENKINNILHTKVLILKISDNKIEITNANNKQLNYHSTKEPDIKYFMETIVSLKKFMSSLVKL
jgi:CheY-like chemotaxis protein